MEEKRKINLALDEQQNFPMEGKNEKVKDIYYEKDLYAFP